VIFLQEKVCAGKIWHCNQEGIFDVSTSVVLQGLRMKPFMFSLFILYEVALVSCTQPARPVHSPSLAALPASTVVESPASVSSEAPVKHEQTNQEGKSYYVLCEPDNVVDDTLMQIRSSINVVPFTSIESAELITTIKLWDWKAENERSISGCKNPRYVFNFKLEDGDWTIPSARVWTSISTFPPGYLPAQIKNILPQSRLVLEKHDFVLDYLFESTAWVKKIKNGTSIYAQPVFIGPQKEVIPLSINSQTVFEIKNGEFYNKAAMPQPQKGNFFARSKIGTLLLDFGIYNKMSMASCSQFDNPDHNTWQMVFTEPSASPVRTWTIKAHLAQSETKTSMIVDSLASL